MKFGLLTIGGAGTQSGRTGALNIGLGNADPGRWCNGAFPDWLKHIGLMLSGIALLRLVGVHPGASIAGLLTLMMPLPVVLLTDCSLRAQRGTVASSKGKPAP